jgi:uncharacterized protein involved in exopolysaccharide biosynthesis
MKHFLIVAIVLIVAAAGASIGYFAFPPTYHSIGLIRIRSYLPQVFRKDDQAGIMPGYEAFVQSQVEFMQTRRVVDQAMQHPDWKALGRGSSPEAASEFIKSIQITHRKNAETIRVEFTDKDPVVAAIGARAVVEAFERLYVEDDVDGAKRMSLLENRKSSLAAQLKGITDRIQAIGKPYGSDKLDPIFEYKLQEQLKAESELKAVQLALAQAQGRRASSATTQSTGLLASATVEQLRAQEASLRVFYDKLKTDTMTLGESRFEIENLRAEADTVRRKLAETNDEIDRRNLEGMVSGRLDIMSRGDRPELPATDRRILLASIGGIVGIGLTLGVVLLIALASRQVPCVAHAQADREEEVHV